MYANENVGLQMYTVLHMLNISVAYFIQLFHLTRPISYRSVLSSVFNQTLSTLITFILANANGQFNFCLQLLFRLHKIKAVAILPSTAICPWNLFRRSHSCVFI